MKLLNSFKEKAVKLKADNFNELALDIEVLHELQCDNEDDCDQAVKLWHDNGDMDFELENDSVFEFTEEGGSRVIIIKKHLHDGEGEEI